MEKENETKEIKRGLRRETEILEEPANIGQMTLYQVNQSAMTSMEPLDEYQLVEKEHLLKDYVKKTDSKYYMLLNNETHYYTVFVNGAIKEPTNDSASVEKEILNCLAYIGDIKAVEANEDNVFEIWAQPKEDVAHVYYFFPYDAGVIECE